MTRGGSHVEPGALYHFISRFVAKEWFIESAVERAAYLALLGEMIGPTDWRCFSYAVMSSHIHLGLVAGTTPLASWLRPMHTRFARWTNRRRDRIGSVFVKGPSMIGLREEGAARLIEYIHCNPVRAGVVSRPNDNDWTSHRAYTGAARRPSWLDVECGLELGGFADGGALDRWCEVGGTRREELEALELVARRRPGRPRCSLRGSGGGEEDRERRSLADGGAHANVTAVGADDFVADGQAKAGAVGARREEGLEDAREVVGGDAAAEVLDLDRDLAIVGGGGAERDVGAGLAGVGGVADEIDENLAEALRVALDREGAWLGLEGDTTLGEDGGEASRGGLDELADIDRFGGETDGLGEVEDFGDRLVEAGELLERDVEVLAVVVGELELATEDLYVERDGGQRRADVVGDGGGELAERGEAAGFFELGHGLGTLDDDRDSRRELPRDEIGIAIDEAVVEVKGTDDVLIKAECGDDEASGEVGTLVAAERLAVPEIGGDGGWELGERKPANGGAVADGRDTSGRFFDRELGAGGKRVALDAESAGAPFVEAGEHAALDARIERVADGSEREWDQRGTEEGEILVSGGDVGEDERDCATTAEDDEQADRGDRDDLGRRGSDGEQLAAENRRADHDARD